MSDSRPEPLKPKLGVLRVLLVMASIAKHLGLGAYIARAGLARMLSEKKKAAAFAGYLPDEHDVFVATFAKSGTNWMMQIAQQIACRGAAEFDHIHQLVPWPDAPGPSPLPLSDTRAREAAPTGLRVIKTHLETAYLPYSEKARYLTVIRDPKEVLVSSYYFLGGMMNVLSHVSIDQWFDIFMAGGALGTGWAVHTASFWAWRDRPNLLVMNYADIKGDARPHIERVARLMGVSLDESEMATVVERSSFAWMKAHESQFAPPRMPMMKEAERPRMVRRGEAGGSDELLSPAQQAAVDQLCQAELQRLGSDFPYASWFPLAAETADSS